MVAGMLSDAAHLLPGACKFLKECADNRKRLPLKLKKAERVLEVARRVTEDALTGGMSDYMLLLLTNAAEDLASEAQTTKDDEEAMESLSMNMGAVSAATGSHAATLQEMIDDVEKQIKEVLHHPDYPKQERHAVGARVVVKGSGREGVVLQRDLKDPTLTYKIRFSDGSEDFKGRDEVAAAPPGGPSPPSPGGLDPTGRGGPGAQPAAPVAQTCGSSEQQDRPGEYVVLAPNGAPVTADKAGRGGSRLDTLAFGAKVKVLEVKRLDDACQQRVRGRVCLDGGREGWISLADTSDMRRFAERADTSDYAWAAEVFGPALRTKSGIRATQNALDGATRIGVYFSASWCPPCRSFTAELAKAHGPHAEEFPVVYVPCEAEESLIEGYYDAMPWFALPQTCVGCGGRASTCGCGRHVGSRLMHRFRVRGIPHMVVLEWHGGAVVSTSARDEVQQRRFDLKSCLQLWGADRDECRMPDLPQVCTEAEAAENSAAEESTASEPPSPPRPAAAVAREPAVAEPAAAEPAAAEPAAEPAPEPAAAERWTCPKCDEPNKAQRSACNNCGACRPGSSPSHTADREAGKRKGGDGDGKGTQPPRLLRVTGMAEQIDGMYERGEAWNGLPTWAKYEDASRAMVMYADRAGRWAVARPEGVASDTSLMVSQVHQKQWPQHVQQWGVCREGGFQQLGRVAVQQCADFTRGDTVYYQGPEKAFQSGDRLQYGLRGEVQGLEEDGRVEVRFDSHRLTTPLRSASLSRTPLAGRSTAGCHRGDVVFYTGTAQRFRSGDRLVAGMRGKVVDLEDGDACVRFEGHRCQSRLPSSDLSKEDVYQLRGVVFYTGRAKAFDSGDRLRPGLRGIVVDFKDNGLVSVRFDGHRCNTPTSRSELSKTPAGETGDSDSEEDPEEIMMRLLGARGFPFGPRLLRPSFPDF